MRFHRKSVLCLSHAIITAKYDDNGDNRKGPEGKEIRAGAGRAGTSGKKVRDKLDASSDSSSCESDC